MFPAAAAIKRFVTRTWVGKWVLLPVGAAALWFPAIAQAGAPVTHRRGDGDFRIERRDNDHRPGDYRGRDRHEDRYDPRSAARRRPRTNIDVDIRIGRRHDPMPEYRQREVRVWVPPVYRTVIERKWVEPVYRTEYEQVWVPPVYEDREVGFIGDHGRLRTQIERVLVCDGYYKTVERRVCVSEGYWEN